MAGPSWAAGLLAAVMIVTAVYCGTRLAAAWRWRRRTEYDVDGAHVFMGVAMAGMLVPRLDLVPHGSWEVIFGAAAAWFGWRAARPYLGRWGRLVGRNRSAAQSADAVSPAGESARAPHPAAHHAHHLLACGAMLYMLLAVSAGSAAMSAASMARTAGASAAPPPLTLGLALALFVGVLWAANRLVAAAPTAVAAPGVVAADAVAGGPGGIMAVPAGAGNRVAGAAGNETLTRSGRPISPRLAAGCEIVMGLTMGYMLIMMV